MHYKCLPCVILPTPLASIHYRWYLEPVCGSSLLDRTLDELSELFEESPYIVSRSAWEARDLNCRLRRRAGARIVTDHYVMAPLASLLDSPGAVAQHVAFCTPLLPLLPVEAVEFLACEHRELVSDLMTVTDPGDPAFPRFVSGDLLRCITAMGVEQRSLLPLGNPFPALKELISSPEFSAFFQEQCGRAPICESVEPQVGVSEVSPAVRHPADIKALGRAVRRAGGRLPVRGCQVVECWSRVLVRRERAKLRLAAMWSRSSRRPPNRLRRKARVVLYVAVESAYSGAEASFALLATRIRRDRYMPLAVVGVEGVFAERLRAGGVPTIVPGFAYWDPSVFNVTYFINLMRRHEVDLVHINGWSAHAARLAARLLAIPVVSHLRVFPEPAFVAPLSDSTAVICVSEAVALELRRYPIAARIFAIHNGVDQSEFPSRGEYRRRPERVVLWVANVHRGKAQDLLVSAIPLVCRVVPNVRFLFAGDILDPGYYGRLRKLSQELSCDDRLEFLGFRFPLHPLYERADVFVLASVREPFSRAVLEAQAVGVPIVAAASGGTPEIIQDGVNGLLFRERTPEALAEAIVRVLTDDDLGMRLVREGRQIIGTCFTIERHVEEVMDAYDALLAGSFRDGHREPPSANVTRPLAAIEKGLPRR